MYQGFVISGALLLFSAVAFFTAVLPGIRSTLSVYENLKQIEKEIQSLSGKRSFLESLSEDNLRGQLAVLLSVVPEGKTMPSLFTTVEGLANTSGVSLTDMTIANPGSLATGAATRVSAGEKKIGASTLPFSIAISGTYDQIRAFVSQVNKARRLFDVTGFDLSITNAGVTQVRLTLSAFFQTLPTKVGSVQAPIVALSPKEEELLGVLGEYPDFSQASLEPLVPVLTGIKTDPFAR